MVSVTALSVGKNELAEPPRIGQHTIAILQDLGYKTVEINKMIADGVVASWPPLSKL